MELEKKEKIILYDSPEAAHRVSNISGWVSSNGRFWGEDEHMARYDGSTHKKCEECGEVISKSSYCRPCHARHEAEKYAKMERKEWDGKAPLYSQVLDEFFFSEEDVELCLDGEAEERPICTETFSALQMVICNPQFAHQINPENEYCDQLPGDGELPEELQAAFDELNAAIREYKTPLSWTPGKYAATIKEVTNEI